MKQTFGFGLLVLIGVICAARQVWGRPVGADELKEERLAILRRIIEDMKELIYVNDLYEESKLGSGLDLDMYLDSISGGTKAADKRKMPGGFSAVRGKRPHTFSAVRGKRPHTFSAVRGKREPLDSQFYIPDGFNPADFGNFQEDSGKRNAPSGFSFVRGKKDLSEIDHVNEENDNEIQNNEHEDVLRSLAKKSDESSDNAATTNEHSADKRKENLEYLFKG